MGEGAKMKKGWKKFWNFLGGLGILTALAGIVLLLLKLLNVL